MFGLSTFRLIIYGGIALAIVAGLAAIQFYKSRAEHWHAQAEAIQARFDGFVLEAQRLGEEQEAKTREKEESDRAAFTRTVETIQGDLVKRDADLKRLRQRPPARPDRSEVPVTTCRPESANVPAEERVSLADYRALEARAYDDALQLIRLQEWVSQTGHPVE